jgi:hypothetical protein
LGAHQDDKQAEEGTQRAHGFPEVSQSKSCHHNDRADPVLQLLGDREVKNFLQDDFVKGEDEYGGPGGDKDPGTRGGFFHGIAPISKAVHLRNGLRGEVDGTDHG